MNCCKEVMGYRWWASQGDFNDGGWSRPSPVERVPKAVATRRCDKRHLQQLESALQRTDVARASLVHSWLVVRKRLMKKPKVNDGPLEAFRKEAVKRYLEKKRLKRCDLEPMDEGEFCPEPMDESPF